MAGSRVLQREVAAAYSLSRPTSAKSAIEDIKVLQPDAVVIDIGLREGSGFDVLKALCREAGPRPPARIVLTNHVLDQYRKAAQRWGATHFFDKSKEIPEMLQVLRGLPPAANVRA